MQVKLQENESQAVNVWQQQINFQGTIFPTQIMCSTEQHELIVQCVFPFKEVKSSGAIG